MGNRLCAPLPRPTKLCAVPVPEEEESQYPIVDYGYATSDPLHPATIDTNQMRGTRTQQAREFIENVWNIPTERHKSVVPLPLATYCMVKLDTPIISVIHASADALSIGEIKPVGDFACVDNDLIAAIISFLEEHTGAKSLYQLPRTNPEYDHTVRCMEKL